jgi:hypothetical protein
MITCSLLLSNLYKLGIVLAYKGYPICYMLSVL